MAKEKRPHFKVYKFNKKAFETFKKRGIEGIANEDTRLFFFGGQNAFVACQYSNGIIINPLLGYVKKDSHLILAKEEFPKKLKAYKNVWEVIKTHKLNETYGFKMDIELIEE